MKLKRADGPGYWRSADGRWAFIFFAHSRHWAPYRDGDDEPETFEKFDRLRDAVRWAEKRDKETAVS